MNSQFRENRRCGARVARSTVGVRRDLPNPGTRPAVRRGDPDFPALQCATLLRISAASSGKFLLRFQKSQRPVLGDFFCISEFCLSSLQIIAFCNLDLSISVCSDFERRISDFIGKRLGKRKERTERLSRPKPAKHILNEVKKGAKKPPPPYWTKVQYAGFPLFGRKTEVLAECTIQRPTDQTSTARVGLLIAEAVNKLGV